MAGFKRDRVRPQARSLQLGYYEIKFKLRSINAEKCLCFMNFY